MRRAGQRAPTRRPSRFALPAVLLAALLAISPAVPAAQGAHRLIALDVGEGQSILLTDGSHGILIDTGRVGMGQRVLQRLEHYGVEQLDAVIYTHLHPDHAGSWFRIHEAYPDVTVIESGHRKPGTTWPDTSRWVANALDQLPDDQHRLVSSGDEWTWRDFRIRVLWPESVKGGSLNERSLVLQITLGNTTALVMGDVGIDIEHKLLEREALPGKVDILIAGHHGSRGTSSRRFLQHIDPTYAVVSTDRNNIRGYPSAETMARLRHAARAVFRTWVHGDVCFAMTRQRGARLCTQTSMTDVGRMGFAFGSTHPADAGVA